MNKIDLYDKIEDYLKNQLSEEERAVFEASMQLDPELATEVELHKMIMQANTEGEIRAFRNQMESILAEKPSTVATQSVPIQAIKARQGRKERQDQSQQATPRRAIIIRRWLAAAAILLILALWFLRPEIPKTETPFVNKEEDSTAISPKENIVENNNANPIDSETIETPQPRNQKRPINKPKTAPTKTQLQYIALANDEYQPYAGGIRSAEDQDTAALSNLEKAKIYYSEANLKEVLRLLQNPKQGERTEALKLRADAYFKLGQLNKELELFNKAAADFKELVKLSPSYQSDAEWNLLLCYLAQLPKNQSEFDKLLNQISADPNHSFAPKAKELNAKIQRK